MKPFYTDKRNEWRAYLATHFKTETEIWFVFPAKASGEPALSYNDAVEEALCFGWIDGKAGTLDETHHIRRFTPRRKGSPYSRPNIERLIRLDAQGLIHPDVRDSVLPVISAPFVYPADILDALRQDPVVWERYRSFPEPYRRIRVAYIDAARKRPAEFQKRLNNFIDKTRRNQLITGYGGIEKYYSVDPKRMETERLILDRIRETDKEDYFNNISHDKKVLETFICRYAESLDEFDFSTYLGREDLFAIRRKDTDRLIGIILYFDESDGVCEIGYGLGSAYWGHGYATEAVRRFLTYLFDEKGLLTVTASFFAGNDASRRVMEKCGMTYSHTNENELVYQNIPRDLIYYVITRDSERKERTER